jgi:type II secretory pathway pseudopilin PulG
MKSQKKYRAFTLFEIVISLIVLGIIATTFPLILTNITKIAKNVTKEEIILNELSLLKIILMYEFDENNTQDNNFYKDLNASNGDEELLINSYSAFTGDARIGKAEFNNNYLRSGSSLDVSNIKVDTKSGEVENNSSTYDDIDDFNGYETTIELINVKLDVSVYYIEDNATYSDENISFKYDYNKKANKTNIKLIKISSNKGVSLYYPTCNIGASKYLSLEDLSR